MQKIGILNSEIAKVLADMGHTDTIVIGDCGLPVPDGVKKIDLALKLGTPRFLEVVEELAKYMEIEKIHVAAEMQSKNEECWQQMHKLFDGKEWIVTDHEPVSYTHLTLPTILRV